MIRKETIKGLSYSQIEESRRLYGRNELPRKASTSTLQILLSQFLSPLVIVLGIAAIITFALHEYIDFIAILLVILINSLLGFFQENQAHKSLEALQKIIKPLTTVIREGEEMEIESNQLVVGDIVKLKFGDKVPADGIIISSSNLTVNESVLTGESVPEDKKAIDAHKYSTHDYDLIGKENYVYMGTTVMSGFGLFEVRKIGIHTEFGTIAQSLASEPETQTPLQEKLNGFSKFLSLLVALIAIIVFFIGIITIGNFEEILILSVALAVSAIPEGLVISLTVILTLGMQRLLKRKALVRKLVVAETLGSVTTICVDKTGTLTEGKMKVIGSQLEDLSFARVAVASCVNNLNSVDHALIEWIGDKNTILNKVDEEELDILPFNSTNKFSMSLFTKNIYFIGAPEVLLEKSTLNPSEKDNWLKKMQIESSKGRRLIGAAYKPNSHNFKNVEQITGPLENILWLGYIIIEDPIRKEVKTTFNELAKAGIKVKVITGDQQSTAHAIIKQAGIEIHDSDMLSGEELKALDDDDLATQISAIQLFYRTSPDQKYRIVKALQARGEVVAMMGDGINDAPALKTADVGIVVNNATEVSKETADIVLLDSNITTIAKAVEEGRSIFENLRKVITYLLSGSSSEVILIFLSLVLRLPLPLIPLQILFINLIADGFPGIALASEEAEKGLMHEKPRPKNTPLLTPTMITLILIIGVVVNIALFGIIFAMLQTNQDIKYIRSFVFALLAVDSLLYVYSIRSLRVNIWQMNPFRNQKLNIAIVFGLLSILLAFITPQIAETLELTSLSIESIIVIFAIALSKIIAIELIKWYFLARAKK